MLCVHNDGFSNIGPPLDGNKRLFYESAVKTFNLKNT